MSTHAIEQSSHACTSLKQYTDKQVTNTYSTIMQVVYMHAATSIVFLDDIATQRKLNTIYIPDLMFHFSFSVGNRT